MSPQTDASTRWTEFFEFLKSQGLGPKKFGRTISEMSPTQIRDFLDLIDEKTPRSASAADGPFTFVANSSLSGGYGSCDATPCRIRRFGELEQFGAIYSDYLIISDPFTQHRMTSLIPSEEQKRLIGDLEVVYRYQALVQEGLAGFAYTPLHVCVNCMAKTLPGRYKHRFHLFRESIENAFLKRATFKLERDERGYSLRCSAPEDLMEHGASTSDLSDWPAEAVDLLRPLRQGSVSPNRIRRSGAFRTWTEDLVLDLLLQRHYGALYGANYVTNRQYDIELMRSMQDGRSETVQNALSNLGHSFPVLEGVPIERILLMRRREGESFRLYRDALRKALTEAAALSPLDARQVFDDVVRPQLNQIDATIKRSRKLLQPSAGMAFTVSAATVAVALSAGVDADPVKLIAALGGAAGAVGIVDRLRNAVSIPKEARENSYYFLWKATRDGRK